MFLCDHCAVGNAPPIWLQAGANRNAGRHSMLCATPPTPHCIICCCAAVSHQLYSLLCVAWLWGRGCGCGAGGGSGRLPSSSIVCMSRRHQYGAVAHTGRRMLVSMAASPLRAENRSFARAAAGQVTSAGISIASQRCAAGAVATGRQLRLQAGRLTLLQAFDASVSCASQSPGSRLQRLAW